MDDLIDKLAADLRPVRPRRIAVEALALAALLALELSLWLLSGMMRPDLGRVAMTTPTFWWKIGSAAALMFLAGRTTLTSLSPDGSPRRGLMVVACWTLAFLGLGVLLDIHLGLSDMAERLSPWGGLQCMGYVVTLSIPALVALGVLTRRGAATRPGATALASGLTAAGWGAFVFAFSCPHDDPLFIAVWYPVSTLVSVAAARLILPWTSRW